jgi:WD40 repeat protein
MLGKDVRVAVRPGRPLAACGRGTNVGTLQLLAGAEAQGGHGGEVFACAYSADGALVLSGGWDGHLRLWEAETGTVLTGLRAGAKPLSACAFAPDGGQWVSGSMEGMLTFWDAVSHQPRLTFLAHTRPVSAICYAPDGAHLATASWDRQVVLRKAGQEREGRALAGHHDIVAGCHYTQDGAQLLSWSYDGTLRLWDVAAARPAGVLRGHTDRVTAGALSPDDRWAASGGRDGFLRLWDLAGQSEAGSLGLGAEVRACCFRSDAESLLAADAAGRVLLLSVPGLDVRARLETGLPVQCGALAPAGGQAALGCDDGRVHRVAVEGFESSALVVTPTRVPRETTSMLGRFLGKPRVTNTYRYTCPACRHAAEAKALPGGPFPCPGCRRALRFHSKEPQLQGK